MKARSAVGLALVGSCVLWRGHAQAGDPEAHAAAAIRTAQRIADRPEYSEGVGAPIIRGVAMSGMFQIDTEGSQTCPYRPFDPFGSETCPYTNINGRAINEPDNWECIDWRQPRRTNWANGFTSPVQVGITALLASRVSETELVCNWSHFVDNSALPDSANSNAQNAYETTRDWAREILTYIEEEGAGEEACDPLSWEKYYKRSVNALHYIQDAATEHHAGGNIACANSELNMSFNLEPIYDIGSARRCMNFVSDTVDRATGVEPDYWCDSAIAIGPRSDVTVDPSIASVLGKCGIGLSPVPIMSLACMGIERTLRHHCALDEPKTLVCDGLPNDHTGATSNETWCEGEIAPGPGGEDFIAKATDASEPLLLDAVARWAEVCKEPDDPCAADECSNWCYRTERLEGYCVNAAPDAGCVLHECRCDRADECGGAGQPCCTTGQECAGGGLECGEQTGTCVAIDSEVCTCDTTAIPTVLATGGYVSPPLEESCANGPCHYESTNLFIRFFLVPGARTYIVSPDSAGWQNSFVAGHELQPFVMGKLGQSYLTHAEAVNLAGYDQIDPLVDGEVLARVAQMSSNVIREGDPTTAQEWAENNEWFYGLVEDVEIELLPQCDG